MMRPSFTNRDLAKVKFFAVYILSVVLILVVFSSFLSSGPETPVASNGTSRRAVIDDLMHQRMERLQVAAAMYAENGASAEGLAAMEREKAAVKSTLDSILKSVASVPDTKERAELESLLNTFRRSVETQNRLLANHAPSGTDSSGTALGQATPAELEQMKSILLQKEARIAELEKLGRAAMEERDRALASLQSSPQRVASPTKADAGAAEWKDKYNKLKAATEKTASQLESLKASYKEVVDDNRRLISQLQSQRAAKN